MSIGYGSSIIIDGAMFIVDCANAKGVSGNDTYDILTDDKNLHIGTPIISNGGLICDGTQFMAIDGSTHNTAVMTMSLLYTRVAETGTEDIIVNKENCWEVKDDAGNISWAIYTSNQTWFWHDTTINVGVGETAYIVISYDGTNIKSYKNAELIETYVYPANGTLVSNSSYYKFNSRNATLGTIQNPGYHTLHHWINYNRVLSDLEIKQNFNALRGRYGI